MKNLKSLCFHQSEAWVGGLFASAVERAELFGNAGKPT